MSDALERLARAVGVLPTYTDGLGVGRSTPADALVTLLAAVGLPLEAVSDAEEALAWWEAQQADRVLAPVVVAWDGSAPPAWVAAAGRAPVRCRLVLEDGTVTEWVDTEGEPAGGAHATRRAVPLPGDLPVGRHRLTVEVAGREAETVLLSAPTWVHPGPFAPGSREWAAFLPLHAAWRPGSWGVGDVGDLRRLADWAARQGARAVSTLPMLAAFLDDPCEPSPYSPASRVAWNELHLDLDEVDDELWDAGARAARAAAGPDVERLARGGEVEHAAAMRAKRQVIEALADALERTTPRVRAGFDAFVAEHPHVADYARFRAAGEVHGPDWRTWPEPLRGGSLPAEVIDSGACRYHEVAQWLIHEQLRRLGTDLATDGRALYLDLPLGSHPHGFDVWRGRGLFADGVAVGAPPDAFFPTGQNWGFPPMRPDAGEADGWRHLTDCLDHQMQVAGLLRLDHVMGLHRLFWIPDGGTPTDGAYVHYPSDQLAAVVSLASHRWSAGIVGEDLGTVPPEVRALLERHRIRGMYVGEFETTDDQRQPLRSPRPGSVAAISTHDLPTFAGWWQGHDITDRLDLGLLDESAEHDAVTDRDRGRRAMLRLAGTAIGPAPDEPDPAAPSPDTLPRPVLDAALAFLGRSPAELVVVDVEDLWLETEPQNVPGTSTERPNWRRRARYPVTDLDEVPGATATLAGLTRARDEARHEAEVLADDRTAWLTADDLHLFNEGSHFTLHDKLGAHLRVIDGVVGVQFAVWAPNAERVSVIGSFNGWDDADHALAPLGSSGIWQGFAPGVVAGDLYKFRIHSKVDGYRVDKADPFAFRAEVSPRTASVVWHGSHDWGDGDWMAARARHQGVDRPMSVYEVHLGSWRRVPEEGDRPLTYTELAPLLADHCERLGFTHVELMPVMEHPLYSSWGYQITGFFAPTSRYGTPDDLKALIDHLHQRGIGVILDWVPSHFPSDEHGLGFFDGTYLFEHADPRKRIQPDWQSLIFNYGRREVQSFLISNAMFWLDRFHADGLRLDAVASMLYLDYSREAGEWIPNEYGGRENLEAVAFLRRLNTEVYGAFPDAVVIAEESTAWPSVTAPVHHGGLGFGFKWDMGWMNDTLRYLRRDPAHRRWHHHELTFRSIYSSSENFVLPLSHDEVVHGKGSLLGAMPGDDWQRFAGLRLLYGYQYTVPGKPLLFMGAELGQWDEWDHDRSLSWHLLDHEPHAGIERWVAELNRLVTSHPALHELDTDPAGFSWVDADDAERSIYSWLRFAKDGLPVVVVMNATPVAREAVAVGVPSGGRWQVVANSDEARFGGRGDPVATTVDARSPGTHGRPHALDLVLPPMAILVLRPTD